MSIVNARTIRALTPCLLGMSGIIPLVNTPAVSQSTAHVKTPPLETPWQSLERPTTLSAALDSKWYALHRDLERAVTGASLLVAVPSAGNDDYSFDTPPIDEASYMEIVDIPSSHVEYVAPPELLWDDFDEAVSDWMLDS